MVEIKSEDGSSMFARWSLREIHRAARAAHEMNRTFCGLQGDHTQLPWDSAPGWAQESAVEGVKAIALDPTMTPEKSHESWTAHKLADGWTWGETKDTERREHPCLVPYDELPPLQKVKDSFFGITVRSFLGIDCEARIELILNDSPEIDDEPTDPNRPRPKADQIGE